MEFLISTFIVVTLFLRMDLGRLKVQARSVYSHMMSKGKGVKITP